MQLVTGEKNAKVYERVGCSAMVMFSWIIILCAADINNIWSNMGQNFKGVNKLVYLVCKEDKYLTGFNFNTGSFKWDVNWLEAIKWEDEEDAMRWLMHIGEIEGYPLSLGYVEPIIVDSKP